MALTVERRKEILDTLTSRGVNFQCPQCPGTEVSVSEQYARIIAMDEERAVNLGAESLYMMTCAIVLCSNCGYVRFHHLQQLGLDSASS